MPQPNFRVVDNEKVHPKDAARIAVKRFRTNAEREKLGVCNQRTETEANYLSVNDILARSERELPEQIKVKRKYRPNYFLIRILILLALVVGVILLGMGVSK